MENYEFIYRDMTDRWDICKNPVFIARHPFCRAIPKDLTKWGFDDISCLLKWLNTFSPKIKDEKQEEFLREYIW